MVLIIIVWVLTLYIAFSYNSIISLKNKIENWLADIDVQLTNRFDLIENLVNTVKWYANHEKDVLESVTKSRTSFMNANSTWEKIEADNQLQGALKSLFAVSESYPELKANTNFLQLQTELSDLENKVAATRRFFNSTVTEYNSTIESFPTNIIAKIFKFEKKDTYKITNEEEKKVPKVTF